MRGILGWRGRHIREVEVEVLPPTAREADVARFDAVVPEDIEPDLVPAVGEQPAETAPEPVLEPEPPFPHETICEITLWRGYRQASFYARIYVDGGEAAVAQSPPFRPTGKGDLDQEPAAVEAHRALCEHLTESGWIRAGRGTAWYADMFRGRFRIIGADDAEVSSGAGAADS